MTNQALAMPNYVTQLLTMQLTRMGLQPHAEADTVTCTLLYEDGSALSLIVLCVAKRRWLRECPMLALTIASYDEGTRATDFYFNELMDVPSGPTDLRFTVVLASKVRAMAWSLAASGNRGKCLSLPGRPAV